MRTVPPAIKAWTLPVVLAALYALCSLAAVAREYGSLSNALYSGGEIQLEGRWATHHRYLSDNHTDDHHESHDHEHASLHAILLAVVGVLFGGVLQWLAELKLLHLFPYTLCVFVVGVVSSEWAHWHMESEVDDGTYDQFDSMLEAVESINSHIILLVLLPMLIYESASNIDVHVLWKVLGQVFQLAFPGVVMAALLTGTICKACFQYEGWTWPAYFTLASIVSATDPVAVVAALHELGAPARLSTIIDGESLLNDGSAMVLFLIFLDLVDGKTYFFEDYVEQFSQLAIGGVCWGFLIYCIVFIWLLFTESNWKVEVSILLTGVYLSFFCAEIELGVSGVLTVVTFGIGMATRGKFLISPSVQVYIEYTVPVISHYSETIIFFVAGAVTAKGLRGHTIDLKDWGDLVVLYIVIHLVRFAVVMFFYWLPYIGLRNTGYRLSIKEAGIIVWGGLRGAVGLALALIVNEGSDYSTLGKYSDDFKAKVLFHTAGIVVMTMTFNGISTGFLYSWLHPYNPITFENTSLRASLVEAAMQKLRARMRHLTKIVSNQYNFSSFHVNPDVLLEIIPAVHESQVDASTDKLLVKVTTGTGELLSLKSRLELCTVGLWFLGEKDKGWGVYKLLLHKVMETTDAQSSPDRRRQSGIVLCGPEQSDGVQMTSQGESKESAPSDSPAGQDETKEDETGSHTSDEAEEDTFVGKRVLRRIDHYGDFLGKVSVVSCPFADPLQEVRVWTVIYDDGDTENFLEKDMQGMVDNYEAYEKGSWSLKDPATATLDELSSKRDLQSAISLFAAMQSIYEEFFESRTADHVALTVVLEALKIAKERLFDDEDKQRKDKSVSTLRGMFEAELEEVANLIGIPVDPIESAGDAEEGMPEADQLAPSIVCHMAKKKTNGLSLNSVAVGMSRMWLYHTLYKAYEAYGCFIRAHRELLETIHKDKNTLLQEQARLEYESKEKIAPSKPESSVPASNGRSTHLRRGFSVRTSIMLAEAEEPRADTLPLHHHSENANKTHYEKVEDMILLLITRQKALFNAVVKAERRMESLMIHYPHTHLFQELVFMCRACLERKKRMLCSLEADGFLEPADVHAIELKLGKYIFQLDRMRYSFGAAWTLIDLDLHHPPVAPVKTNNGVLLTSPRSQPSPSTAGKGAAAAAAVVEDQQPQPAPALAPGEETAAAEEVQIALKEDTGPTRSL